ncbi:MAG: hypothetical protein NT023_11825, partial [Armatimonadetes bacterium]|nr:hypothetical protein [Armatimonadota bacterium]
NGKSAFLVNLLQNINKEYCLDISDDVNKCFAVYIEPESGGRTKTFSSFVDLFFSAIFRSNIIDHSLTVLRLEAINALYPMKVFFAGDVDEKQITQDLSDIDWYKSQSIDIGEITEHISKNALFQQLPADFPLFKGQKGLFGGELVTKEDFKDYYFKLSLRRDKERLDFVFTHIVQLFRAAGFTGVYALVDDFERIPDYQSARQKRDFALELRTCLFDGLYSSAKLGFYNIILVLHAGVQRLISESWAESGMENRAPISPQIPSKHVIPFVKLSREHTKLLIRKYLFEYRINADQEHSDIHPFTEEALTKIGELSEYNAARILKIAYELLDKAATEEGRTTIDDAFVTAEKETSFGDLDRPSPALENSASIDLLGKAQGL